MRQFPRAGPLEAEHLAPLGIDPRHDVFDRAVLAGGVHCLEDQQQGVAAVRVEQVLHRAELLDMMVERLEVLLLRLIVRFDLARPFLEPDFLARTRHEICYVYFHLIIVSC